MHVRMAKGHMQVAVIEKGKKFPVAHVKIYKIIYVDFSRRPVYD